MYVEGRLMSFSSNTFIALPDELYTTSSELLSDEQLKAIHFIGVQLNMKEFRATSVAGFTRSMVVDSIKSVRKIKLLPLWCGQPRSEERLRDLCKDLVRILTDVGLRVTLKVDDKSTFKLLI